MTSTAGQVDAVVVGAGHNGLVAANLLADAGWDVLVLEASPHPGGAVRSDESTMAGFVTDLFSAFFPLAVASPVMAALNLDRFGLSWTHAPAALTHLLPDGRAATIWPDRERTAASVERFAPGDGEAWLRMVAEFERVQEPVLQALFRPFPPVRPAVQLLRRLGTADALRLARLGVASVRRLGDERFAGEGARLLLAGNALHTDLPPEGAGSAVFGWLLAMLGQTVGFPVPVGGTSRIVDALVQRLEKAGGTLRLDSPVERVVVEGGAATGVRLRGGEQVSVRRAVLADVAAPALYRDLVGVDQLPPRLVRDLDTFEWDTATLKVNWALGGPIPWQNPDAAAAGTVHLGADMNGLTYYAADLAAGKWPAHPFLLLGQMTTSDPSRSPAGTESAWAYTHLPAGSHVDAGQVREHVALVEAVIERQAPGFRDCILARTVQGPAELQAADANLFAGAVNGGTTALHQQLVFRPVPGLARAETPVERLYLAGASAHPGGGVHGACGSNAARAALARDTLRGRVTARAVRAAHRRIYAD
jgi:phytoene dehydrogenase-like protein